ncbi:hypothetical protein B0I27_105100 [Arcticibacter pallidicorallinus]|uniref:Uncharacterized protein n=1 Tax=Arcticibacter pallidicorallinus TaxID=1259464 RepID=A0A2T0U402_9SPHI|nr:hypothetical protein B0I27_105100 [Arcticibacter pallidicorallinus]
MKYFQGFLFDFHYIRFYMLIDVLYVESILCTCDVQTYKYNRS